MLFLLYYFYNAIFAMLFLLCYFSNKTIEPEQDRKWHQVRMTLSNRDFQDEWLNICYVWLSYLIFSVLIIKKINLNVLAYKNKYWSIFYTNVLLVLHQSKEFNGDNILFYLELELRPSSTLWIGNMSYDGIKYGSIFVFVIFPDVCFAIFCSSSVDICLRRR
jgi:hypothetical protein